MSYSRFAYVPRMAFDTESGDIIDITRAGLTIRRRAGGRLLSASEKNYQRGRALSEEEQSYTLLAARVRGSWEEH